MNKLYKGFFLTLVAYLLFPLSGFSTHIVGGSLTYQVGAGNTYTVTLKLYRDCSSATGYPGTVDVNILNADGTAYSTPIVTLNPSPTTSVTATLPPCASAPPSPPCVEEKIYTGTVVLPPSDGGYHLYYSLCCRNQTITNITNVNNTSPGDGETFYAFIPGFTSPAFWDEDFGAPLVNGDIVDNGTTAWSITPGAIPTTTASVNNNLFEVTGANGSSIWLEDFTLANNTTTDAGATAWTRAVTGGATGSVQTNQFRVTGANNGTMTLTTQTVSISAYPDGVFLSMNLSKGGTLDPGDNITVSYSIDGGSPVVFPHNSAGGTGSISDDFAALSVSAAGLKGNNIQVIVTVTYDAASPNTEIYNIDNILIGASASMTWATQTITISSYTAGVTANVDLSEAGTMDVADNITVSYSLNGGAPITFPTNGSIYDDFTSAVASASGLSGNTIQIFIKVSYDAVSPTSEIYRWDNVKIFDDGSFPSNSSPDFNSTPPLYLCGVNSFTIDAAATDPNGDSLVYSMYTPFTDITPTFPGNIATFTLVGWVGSYSANSPFNSPAPPVTLSSTTGQITGVANTNGRFVFGVKCTEYRNGVYLSYIVRDFQANVVTCPPFVPATPTATVVNTNGLVCTGQTLSLSASSTDPSPTYSWTGPNGFTSSLANPTIPAVTTAASGTYSVVSTVTGCNSSPGTVTVTIDVAPTSPTATSNNPVCAGSNLSLAATATGSTYNWSGPNSYTSTTQNPIIGGITLAGTGTYSVIAISAAGCASGAGTVSVTVNSPPTITSSATATNACYNAAAQNSSLSYSATTNSPTNYTITWNAAALAAGLVNVGSTALPASPITVPIAAGVAAGVYTATLTVTNASGCPSAGNAFTLTINLPPTITSSATAASVCYNAAAQNSSLSYSATTNSPTNYTITWDAAALAAGLVNVGSTALPASPITVPIAAGVVAGVYTATLTVTNASGCASTGNAFTLTINPLPTITSAATAASVCFNASAQNSSLTYSATTNSPTNYTITWNAAALAAGLVNVGSTALPASPITVPIAAGVVAGTYTGTLVVTNGNGCASTGNAFTLTINPLPTITSAATAASVCFNASAQNSSLTYSATTNSPTNYTITWNAAALAAGLVNVGSTALPASPITVPIAAGVVAGTYNGTLVVTNGNGCASTGNAFTLTINPLPTITSAATAATVCYNAAAQNSSLTYSATTNSPTNYTITWNAAALAAGLVNVGSTALPASPITVPIAAGVVAGVYTATLTVTNASGCASTGNAFTLTINPLPTITSAATAASVCFNASAQNSSLTYSATTNSPTNYTITWNAAALAAGLVNVGSTALPASPITVPIAAGVVAGTYNGTLVVTNGNGCASTGNAFTLTITPTDDPSFNYSTGTYCPTGTTTPTITGGFTGTFSETPAGLVFVSTNTGELNLGASTPGTYTVTFTTNGPCPAQSSEVITITSAGVADFHYSSPVCNSSADPSPVFDNGGSAGVFSSSPAGIIFVSASTGQIDLSASTVGTYTVTNTITAAGCFTVTATNTVTIDPAATVNAGTNQTICAGNSVTLAGAIGGSASSATWSGGAGSYSPNNTTLNAAYTPSAGEVAAGSVTLTLTTDNPAGACGSVADNVIITITPLPAAPTAAGTVICAGFDATLTATAPGGTYEWFDAASGGTLLQTGATYTTPTLTTTTTYYVQTTVTSCAGPMTAVTVTVNPLPVVTSASSATLCSGGTVNIPLTSNIASTFTWIAADNTNTTGESTTLQSTSTLNNTIVNNTLGVEIVSYTVTPTTTVTGCTGPPQTVTVTVNPKPSLSASSNSPVCLGGNINLTATTTGGSTFVWSGPNSYTSTSQNPTISPSTTSDAGNYTVTTTSAAGCVSSNSSTNVIVNPPAPPPACGSNSPVCSGQTISLNVTSIISASYSWAGPNGFTSTLQNPTKSNSIVADAGTYSIIATVPGCGPSSTGTVAVTVNPTPAAPAASCNNPVCSGNDISLTANGTGTSYNWTGPGSFTSTAQNPIITAAATTNAGTYSVITTSADGCVSTLGTVAVTVNQTPAAPTASSNSPVCSGNSLNLFATSTGTSYTWSGPNTFTSTSQNPTIAVVTTAGDGTYSVTATTSGCTGAAGTVSVTINQTPAAPTAGGNTPICVGFDLSLSASTIGSSTYNWSGPSGYTSTSQNPILTGVAVANAGNYSVTATENGCTGSAGVINIAINALPATPTAGSNSPICEGMDISLSASNVGGTTYSWSGPNGYTSASQNPIIYTVTSADAGTYSVTATSIATGCSSVISTTTVIVNPPPSAPTAGSNSPVCSGNTLSLTATTVAAATYSWSGPNSFTSTLQNPNISNVTVAASGIYSLNTSVAGCPPLSTQTVSVTINATPASPNAGSNTPVCLGNNISLTATSTGVTYSWTGPGGYTSTSQNPVINGATTAQSGAYSVTAISGAGCPSSIKTTNVTVNPPEPAPTAGSNSPLCSGQTLTLTSSVISSGTYAWSGPNSFTSSLQNPTLSNVTTADAGTYSVVAIVPGCGASPAGTVSVTINPVPSAPTAGSNSTVCSGQDLSLTATAVGGATYSWNGPNSYTSTVQDPVIIAAATSDAGTYTVNLTVSGCTSPDATVLVAINQTPSVPTVGSNSPVCEGQDLSLTASSSGSPTYSWNGPNAYTSASQNPVLTAVTTADAGTYSVNAIENGCISADASVSVIINPTPAAPTAGSNTPICSGETLSLTANTPSGISYSWNGPNGFTSTTQNPNITNASAAASGTYTVTADIGGCTGPAGVTSVTVNPTPNPTASSNSPVCEGNTLQLNATNIAGATYSWSGPNAFTSAIRNPSIAVTTTANSGTYSLTVTSSLGCVSSIKITLVTITPPISADAGTDQTICANNAIVSLNGSVSGGTSTGDWTTSGTGTFTPTSTTLNAAYDPSTADTTAGSVILTLTSTNNGGCPAAISQVTITITDAPVANAGADQTVCANNAIVLLNGSVNSVATGGLWSTPGSGTFVPTASTLNATYDASPADTAAGSVKLVLTTTGNGLCNAATDTMTIFFAPSPIVDPGISTVACKNNANVPLNGITSTGSGTWTTSGTGTFSPTAATLNATYISSTADTTAGSVILTLTSSNNGSCNAVSRSITITYIDKPIVIAGSDVTVCGNNADVSLSGTSNTGSVTWSTIGTGSFVPSANTLNTTYHPSAGDIATGTVTIVCSSSNNGTCTVVRDTLDVTITPAPTVNAGADQTVCANNGAVTLSGSFTVSSGAGWTTSGTGTFSPDTMTMNGTYTPSAADTTAGTVNIILTSTGNGLCNAVTDTMKIIITPAPSVNAGADQTLCFSNVVSTLNGTSSTGAGQWSTLGSGIFGNSASLSTTYTPSNADTAAEQVSLVLTSTGNGTCNASTDTIVIYYSNPPTISAGTDLTVCANNSTVTLTGSSSTGTGYWTTSGNGTFVPDSSALNGTYTPDLTDITTGTVTLTLHNIDGCAPVADSILITITPAPTVNAGANVSLCAGTMTASLNGISSTGSGQWSTSGTGTFTPNNTTLNAVYTLTPADSASGLVTLTLTSSNNGSCNAVADQMKIYITQPPVANAGTDATVCGNNSLVLNGTISGGSGNGVWSTPNGSGSFSPSTSDLNASYLAVNADTVAGNILLILTTTNNGGCAADADTVVVTVNSGPIANAGADQTICSNNPVASLSGSVINAAGGGWITMGTGTFSPDTSTLNAIYNASPADVLAGSVNLVLATTGNGQCNSTTDTLLISFGPSPVVNAGVDIPVCHGNTTAQLNGTVSGGASTGQWSTLGSGTFSPNITTLNATYLMSNADTTAGTVTLILTSTNFGNCLAVTDTVKINITNAPIVAAGSDITVCANNDTIVLNGSITAGGSTGYWSTGGTGIFIPDSSALNASYVPSAADTTAGSIVLTLQSTNGCRIVMDSLTATITPAPLVNAGSDIALCAAISVALNGSVSGAASGGQWSTLGNGTFVPDNVTLNASYVFGTNDTSTVTIVLTSTGNGQCLAVTDTMKISLGNKPVAGFSNTQICSGHLISFTDTSIAPSVNDSIVSWNWTIAGTNDTVQNPTHTYSVSGTDSVTLIITTNSGCMDTVMHLVSIHPSPTAAFTHTVDCTVDSVYFTSTSTIPSGAITTWNWNFGDGSTSALQNPVHSYSAAGTHTVTLTVTSDSGCTATFVDSVGGCISVQAGFTSASSLCAGLSLSFTDTSLISGTDSIAVWNWNFGDGGSDTVQNPSHTYTTGGTYSVTLIVITNSGATDTASHTVLVNPSPSAAFTYLSSCGLDSVYFFDASTITGGTISSWSWNFGDGNISSLQNPAHYYDSTGVYVVSLTVMTDSGCSSTFIDTIINAKGITASFTDTADCQFNVAFNDSYLLSPSDSIVSWNWNFGDGNTDTIHNPVHSYTASGTYTVQLIATSSGGCKDTVLNTITLLPLPVADYTPAGGTFYQGVPISFTDHSLNASSWIWNFGDGSTDINQDPAHTYDSHGIMNVVLIAINASGCSDTVNYPFTIYPNTVAVPSGFSPNGDGVNDALHVMGGPMKDMDFSVYNEWGNEVYHSTVQSEGWDGTYKGKDQPAARYIYILKGTTVSGDIIDMNGEVTITR